MEMEGNVESIASNSERFSSLRINASSLRDRIQNLNDQVLNRRQCLLNSLKRYEAMNKSILERSAVITVAENYLLQQTFLDSSIENLDRIELNYKVVSLSYSVSFSFFKNNCDFLFLAVA